MSNARCFLPGSTYLIEVPCPVNTYIFTPEQQAEALFCPLLANAANLYNLTIHAYVLLPDRHFILVTIRDEETNLPECMKHLHGNMNTYVRMTTGRDTPIYRHGTYKSEEILTPQDALLAYVRLLTAAQNYGFSASNGVFRAGIISLEQIGDPCPTLYEKPECLGDNANFECDEPNVGGNGSISLEFPLPPQLADREVGELRNEIQALVDRAREGISEFRQQANVKNYPEEHYHRLPAPPAPRPRNETHAGLTYHAMFPYIVLLDDDEQAQTLVAQEEFQLWKIGWQRNYSAALHHWRNGNRNFPFPLGTQKMHFLHRCELIRQDL